MPDRVHLLISDSTAVSDSFRTCTFRPVEFDLASLLASVWGCVWKGKNGGDSEERSVARCDHIRRSQDSNNERSRLPPRPHMLAAWRKNASPGSGVNAFAEADGLQHPHRELGGYGFGRSKPVSATLMEVPPWIATKLVARRKNRDGPIPLGYRLP